MTRFLLASLAFLALAVAQTTFQGGAVISGGSQLGADPPYDVTADSSTVCGSNLRYPSVVEDVNGDNTVYRCTQEIEEALTVE